MVFLHLWRQCGVSHEVQRGIHGASLVVSGKSGLHSCCEGELGIALESRQRNLAQDTLKGVSPGLSRVATGNPGFPRHVTVTSGSFSGCLWEVRNTVELERAARYSTGFGANEEGLNSS